MFCSVCGDPLNGVPPTVCESCGAHHWNNPKPGSSALITAGESLLFVRRANEPWRGYWDVPGGFCDPGEHPEETAMRESLEEAGASVELGPLVGMWMDSYDLGDEVRPIEHVLAIYYLATLKDDALGPVDPVEVAEVRWFEADALPELVAFPQHLPKALAAWREIVQHAR